jgi:serine/threonine-protein kinase ATR
LNNPLKENIKYKLLDISKLNRTLNNKLKNLNALLALSHFDPCAHYDLERAKFNWADGKHTNAINILESATKKYSLNNFKKKVPHDSSPIKCYELELYRYLARYVEHTGTKESSYVDNLFKECLKPELISKAQHYYLDYALFLNRKLSLREDRMKEKTEDFDEYQREANATILNYSLAVSNTNEFAYKVLPRLLALITSTADAIRENECKNCKVTGKGDKRVEHKCASCSDLEKKREKLYKGVFEEYIPLHVWMIAISQILSGLCSNNELVKRYLKKLLLQLSRTYTNKVCWYLLPSKDRDSIIKLSSTEEVRINQQCQTFAEDAIACLESAKLDKSNTSRTNNAKWTSKKCPDLVCLPVLSQFNLSLVQKSGNADSQVWSTVVTIKSIDPEVVTMHSLCKPIRIGVKGSDGKQYYFLAKAEDSMQDMRKDQRVMEVILLINKLLKEYAQTRNRKLFIQTFAITPLSVKRSNGLFEWVENTSAIKGEVERLYKSAYGEKGFKERASKCSTLYHKDGKDKTTPDNWRQITSQIYPPIFHKYFLTKFTDPTAWFYATSDFTKSTAVMSMVGHIVGLGDRHLDNILIDGSSGGAVHVDFNCLFLKGCDLGVPELVPFRLTPNMVDAFGINGCEGTFRVISELTLQMIRSNKESIFSVLETLVYDPLTEWKDYKKKNFENVAEHSNFIMKELNDRISGRMRDLSTHKSKTRVTEQLSVEGHVNKLIIEATKVENLAPMFVGWQSYW